MKKRKTWKRNTSGLIPIKPGEVRNPTGRPVDHFSRALKKLTPEQLEDMANLVVLKNMNEVLAIAKNKKQPAITAIIAQAMAGAYGRKEFKTFDQILDRMMGKSRAAALTLPQADHSGTILSFTDFCIKAGYAAPYPKQIEMRKFGIESEGVRLLLGSRGYGKTDYVVILGIAYEIYLNPGNFTALVITKSDERNAAILAEIGRILLVHRIPLEKNNSDHVRVAGLVGKDHSASAVTVGTSSLRGRHPKLVVFDDPVTPEDTSPATRRRVKKVYDEVVGKICNNVLLIGQPVHRDDLYQTLRPKLKNKMEVPFGQIPELDPDLEVQKLAGVSQETIDASYHLIINSTNATPFDAVKYIDDLPKGSGVAWIDPSEGGDYTALCIMKGLFEGVAFQGFVYKKAWYHALDDMLLKIKAADVKRLGFETNTTGGDPIEKLNTMLPAGIGVVGKRTTKNKEAKIMNAGTFAPFIHLAKTSDPLFIEQVVKYEVGAEYDDAPDSIASLLEWVGLIKGK